MKQAIIILFISLLTVSCFNNSESPHEVIKSDPVCHMDARQSSFTYILEGKTYHFCSESCKNVFLSKPENYLNGQERNLCQNSNRERDYADSLNMGLITADTLKGSLRRYVCFNDETLQIDIDYGSPGVKERVIWGGLVAYDKVWVTGAHNATKITFSEDVVIQKEIIKKGSYALFTIPGKSEWTIILNTNFNQHLADDYKETEDVIRIKVKPRKTKELTPRLTYTINPETDKNVINIEFKWEYMSIGLPVAVKK